MKQFDAIWTIWFLLVIIWNFGVPNADPILDVIVAIFLSIAVYQFKNHKSKKI